jgi:hypothetical protein
MLKIFTAADGGLRHCPREDIERACPQIDDGCGSDSDLRLDEGALHVSRGNAGHVTLAIEETDVPEQRIIGPIRVERIDAVVLRGYEEHIMFPFSRYLDRRHEQWLRAYTAPSTLSAPGFPNCPAFTFCGVKVFSFSVAPVRMMSYCDVVTCPTAIVAGMPSAIDPATTTSAGLESLMDCLLSCVS